MNDSEYAIRVHECGWWLCIHGATLYYCTLSYDWSHERGGGASRAWLNINADRGSILCMGLMHGILQHLNQLSGYQKFINTRACHSKARATLRGLYTKCIFFTIVLAKYSVLLLKIKSDRKVFEVLLNQNSGMC